MKQKLNFILSVIIGNVLLAFAICAFAIPNDIMLGGSNGIALFLQQFIPIRLSVLAGAINVALFLLGFLFLGWKFAATSLMSTLIYPLILAVFESLPMGTLFNENIVISALACGVCCGLGIGLVVRVGGSTGGMDIPPCILNRYKGIPVGTSVLFFDTLVVLMQVVVKGIDGLLLSILVIVVMSATINRTILSGEKKVQIIIISPEYQTIRQKILHDINCGVTMIEVEGGYNGEKQQAILSVVYANKYPVIRDAALACDAHAFIVASDVQGVNGRGYTIERN
jgi:uncharacterized membrane-anchored protein YitT (DUF2179 family)